jgi:hypothetical protein
MFLALTCFLKYKIGEEYWPDIIIEINDDIQKLADIISEHLGECIK